MSEAPDRESRTEEATEKKIQDARDKGNVPVSRDVPAVAGFLCVLVLMQYMLGPNLVPLVSDLRSVFESAGTWSLANHTDGQRLAQFALTSAVLFLVPILLALAVTGTAASLVQNPIQIANERIRPQLSRISPASGFKRIFGARGQFEFLKSLFRFAALAGTLFVVGRAELGDVLNTVFTDASLIPEKILNAAVFLTSCVLLVSFLIAVADFFMARRLWRQDLRMTRHEVKEEFKQSEGDPMLKQRARSIARSRASRRMMSSVPKATVVVTNPTHYAVALRYVPSENAAPVVVAKGADLVALRIRELAGEHHVPVLENKPLARGLYEKVEVNQTIPPEFYRAVAELIYYLQKGPRAGKSHRVH